MIRDALASIRTLPIPARNAHGMTVRLRSDLIRQIHRPYSANDIDGNN